MKKLLKNVARRLGYDILHLPTDPVARQWIDMLRTYQIDLIFDIGANTGQFGQRMRTMGYKGELVSFEPMVAAYKQLEARVSNDPNWTIVHTALGDYDGVAHINVATNSYSSSIRNMLPLHLESAPDAVYSHQEEIRVQQLDSIFDQFYKPGRNLYVKIDTQGFEKQVVMGCTHSIDKISGFQMELSLQQLYEGETLLSEMIDFMRSKGYRLKLIERGHQNYDTGELLQVEGYFFR